MRICDAIDKCDSLVARITIKGRTERGRVIVAQDFPLKDIPPEYMDYEIDKVKKHLLNGFTDYYVNLINSD